jgi:glycosyltransferase involved in cell wall biosynthesis
MVIYMSEHVSNSVVMPFDAATLVRRTLGMAVDSPLRIAFLGGPGDVIGTFDHWVQGAHDPRTPVIAYSSMFYSVVAGLNATAMVLTEQDKQPANNDPRFRFVYTPRRRDRRRIGYWIDQASFSSSVLRHLRHFEPDVIIIGMDAPIQLIRGLPKVRRIVLTVHNTFWPMGLRPSSLRQKVTLWSTASILRRVDVAINTSSECAIQLAQLSGPSGDRSFTEIPQILQNFYPQALKPKLCVSQMLYLGRIEAEKGIFDLLAAFTRLAAANPKLHLSFAGTGSAEPELKDAIVASRFFDRITFYGQLPAKNVHALLDESDLLICPTRSSFREGLALVVIEAAVHGVPSLVSSVVPARNLLTKGCVTFPVDDADALTAALSGMVEDQLKYSKLRDTVFAKRSQFLDRTGSWGTQLYRALALSL